jgi:hypothetical protein
MAVIEELLSVVGAPVNSALVQALITADSLIASAEPDLEEGEPQRSYLSSPTAGYQLMHERGRVETVFLYVEPADGFAAFSGSLPGGLQRGVTRQDVRAKFGQPERSGAPVEISGLGRQGAWDRFAVGAIRIHFQFTEPEQRIRLVTVMTAVNAP